MGLRTEMQPIPHKSVPIAATIRSSLDLLILRMVGRSSRKFSSKSAGSSLLGFAGAVEGILGANLTDLEDAMVVNLILGGEGTTWDVL
jgi:hypothetical protein